MYEFEDKDDGKKTSIRYNLLTNFIQYLILPPFFISNNVLASPLKVWKSIEFQWK